MPIEQMLKQFVERNADTADIQWDPRVRPKLPLDPYDKDPDGKRKAAHYFLLVASILENRLVAKSENARRLVVHFCEVLASGIFEVSKAEVFMKALKTWGYYDRLGPLKDEIPDILVSVNRFVKQEAHGDLVKYSESVDSPSEFVERIARNIPRMGNAHEDKSWVFLRWTVRSFPCLGLFAFPEGELFVPLTLNIVNVAISLGWLDKSESLLWDNPQLLRNARERVTQFAKQLFPLDPAKIDYPFFLLGRLLKGKHLNRTSLEDTLNSLQYLDQVTGHPHSFYQSIARYDSGWEETVAGTLRNMKIHFVEKVVFPLPGDIPKYTPDFVLDQSVQERRIVLEPHYDLEEDGFATKLMRFRQFYGQKFLLILLLRNNDIPYYRARKLLTSDICDDIWPIEDIHFLAERISKGTYMPSLDE